MSPESPNVDAPVARPTSRIQKLMDELDWSPEAFRKTMCVGVLAILAGSAGLVGLLEWAESTRPRREAAQKLEDARAVAAAEAARAALEASVQSRIQEVAPNVRVFKVAIDPCNEREFDMALAMLRKNTGGQIGDIGKIGWVPPGGECAEKGVLVVTTIPNRGSASATTDTGEKDANE